MKIKPSKPRILSLRKGVINDSNTFFIGGEKIQLLSEHEEAVHRRALDEL